MAKLASALQNAQQITYQEARVMIREMKTRVREGEDPEEILYEHGLEPDYVMELLF